MKQTILVVDDEQDIVSIIKVRLQALQYNVISANNGQAGIDMAKTHKPSLIIMDVMMPVMDGITAYEHLHKEEATKDIPVVFLTALLSEGEEKDLIARLGNPYVYILAKPFDTQKVNAV